MLHEIAVGRVRNKGSVVFVHGLGGHPFRTWGGSNASDPLFWPRRLAEEERLADLSFYSFEYQAGPLSLFGGRAMRLPNYGEAVLDILLAESRLLQAPIA